MAVENLVLQHRLQLFHVAFLILDLSVEHLAALWRREEERKNDVNEANSTSSTAFLTSDVISSQ